MFEDEVEELMCDYGLSPMDARSIAKELRATKHALWMARAKICELERLTTLRREWEWTEGSLKALENAERKCREKAKEFE